MVWNIKILRHCNLQWFWENNRVCGKTTEFVEKLGSLWGCFLEMSRKYIEKPTLEWITEIIKNLFFIWFLQKLSWIWRTEQSSIQSVQQPYQENCFVYILYFYYHLYIYFDCLPGFLFVCLQQNLKTAEPIGPKFCYGTSHDPRKILRMIRIFKNLPHKIRFLFCKSRKKYFIISELFLLFFQHCLLNWKCSQLKNIMGAKILVIWKF